MQRHEIQNLPLICRFLPALLLAEADSNERRRFAVDTIRHWSPLTIPVKSSVATESALAASLIWAY